MTNSFIAFDSRLEFNPEVEHRDGTPLAPEDLELEKEFIETVNTWSGTEEAQSSDVVEEFLEGIPQADPEVWAGTEDFVVYEDDDGEGTE